MKNQSSLLTLLVICFAFGCDDDNTIVDQPIEKGIILDTLSYDNVERDFMVYVPQSYDGNESVPVVLNFHPAWSSRLPLEISLEVTGFDVIADRENFIFVTPRSLQKSNGEWSWNTDRLPDHDDVGFINELIDQLDDTYQIDTDRVYASGHASGASFSFTLACELPERIAAIAVSAGYMSNSYFNDCDKSKPIPILQMHGTSDATVAYSGVQPSLDVWVAHNNTSGNPQVDTLDNDASDNSWVEHFLYPDGDQGTTIEHFKVWEGTHSWTYFDGSKDVNAPEEFWRFLSQFDINGKR